MTIRVKERDSCLDYYEANAEGYSAATLNVDMSAVRNRFLKHIPRGGRILDAGCGSGRDAVEFVKDGYSVKLFDGSAKMAERASIYSGVVCEVLRFQDVAFEQEFDGIWSCAALLHVPKAEMNDVLRRLIRALKPGGFAYFSFIEGDDERKSSDGRFYNSYTAESIRDLLSDVGGTTEVDSWKSLRDPNSAKQAPWLNVIIEKKR